MSAPDAYVVGLADRIAPEQASLLGLTIGDRTDALLEAAWSCVTADYRNKPVCTDHWGAYEHFFADAQQACDKGIRLTSIVEGLNQMATVLVRHGASLARRPYQNHR